MARGKKATGQTVTGTSIDNIADTDSVVIVNAKYSGRKSVTSEGVIEFDENGKATVSGGLAKSLLTIPGFTMESGTTNAETEETSTEESSSVEE